MMQQTHFEPAGYYKNLYGAIVNRQRPPLYRIKFILFFFINFDPISNEFVFVCLIFLIRFSADGLCRLVFKADNGL